MAGKLQKVGLLPDAWHAATPRRVPSPQQLDLFPGLIAQVAPTRGDVGHSDPIGPHDQKKKRAAIRGLVLRRVRTPGEHK